MENFHMDTSCEPMDVDLSTNSANLSFKDREEQFNEPPSTASSPLTIEKEPEVWNIKKYHIIRDQHSHQCCSNTTLFVIGVITLLLSFVIYCILGIRCSNDLDLGDLKYNLQNKLYGQSEAIEKFVKSLDNNVKSKVLFLYGGTGVGKTYTISLALENFWNSSNVFHYTMPSFVNTFSTDKMLGLNICEWSIMVVDDLKRTDFDIKKQIAEVIKKSEDLNKIITVILIYNCDEITIDFKTNCDEKFYLDLQREFNDIDVYKSFIKYKPLTQDVLKMCIKDQLKGRIISDVDFNNILNNFNVDLDGCKGVYKKVKFKLN